MATVPIVTDITARVATWNATGIIDAFRDHINATSGTTLLTIDDYNINEGLTVGFTTGGEGQQVNLRKSGTNTIAVGIEPSGSITDAGNSTPTAPTGTSADWSGERTWTPTTSLAAGSKLWCVELTDAFFLVGTDTTNTYHMAILHAGRIAFSTNSAGAATAGQDGLGYCGCYGASSITTSGGSGAGGWFGTANDCSTLHWSTNVWSDHITWPLSMSGSYVGTNAHLAYRPLPPVTVVATDIGSNSSDQLYGVLKYIRQVDGSNAPKTVVADAESNQGWMHVYSAATNTVGPLIIWDKTVTP